MDHRKLANRCDCPPSLYANWRSPSLQRKPWWFLAIVLAASSGQALAAASELRPDVGASALHVGESAGGPTGSMRYLVGGDTIVSDVFTFAASTDWKQRLFDFSTSSLASEDSFFCRRVAWRRTLPNGAIMQEASLRSHSLELRWAFDLKDIAGNLEINVFLPEAALGISPCEAVFQDGRVEKDQLWVEQRAPLEDLRSLTVAAPDHRILIEAGQQRGWQFQDLRRSQQHRGLYRMVLPLYGLKGAFRHEVSVRVLVDPPDAELAPLDLSGVANMGFEDEYEGDRKGGWTDQGDNDLRGFPSGVRYFRGIPFEVLDPATHEGRSAVILRGTERPYFADGAEVAVNRKAAALYFLHACAWAGSGKTALTYLLTYADGTARSIPVRVGEEICDWWGARDLNENAQVAWRGANTRSPVGVMMLRWVNPEPDKELRDITFQCGDGPVVGVIAVTTLSRPLPLHTEADVKGTLPALSIAGAGLIFIDQVFRGTRLAPEYKATDLKTVGDLAKFDLLVVAEDLPQACAQQVEARVREGGRLLVFGPPPKGLGALVPVTPSDNPVLRVPAPYWRWAQGENKAFLLRPTDPEHPIFSGLDPSQFPPTGAFYQIAAKESVEVLAHWVASDGEKFPALVEWTVGKGRVTYLNIARLYPASGGTDYMHIFLNTNRYRDPFFLRLAYHAAGRDEVARGIGEFFRAKATRESLLSPRYDLAVRFENLHAIAGYLGDTRTKGQTEELQRSVATVDDAIDSGDKALEGFVCDQALAAYQRAQAMLTELRGQFGVAEQAVRRSVDQARARGTRLASVRSGPPLLVGSTHVNHGLVYPKGPSRKWVYDWALRRMHEELGWNLFDIIVGGYASGELRPDGKHLQPDALDDIAQSAGEHKMQFILCTVQGAFHTSPELTPFSEASNLRRASVLRELAKRFDRLPAFYGFEPNNEPGMGVDAKSMFGYNPDTFDQLRRWLVTRCRTLDGLNKALGTSFSRPDEIVPPKPEEMGQAGPGDPRRALWAEWIEFRFQLMEDFHRSDYLALRTGSKKPVIDRTAGDGMNWCGVAGSGALDAARQDRRALWHDALGSHVISPFLLDYQAGMSRGERIVQSEYYWSTYGGSSDGLRYRFGGNFMHPYHENERLNFAAVGRNFWKAVSRGNDLFTLYFAIPNGTYGYDEGYWGPHAAYWGDFSFKGMTYAMKVYPQEVKRIRGELLGTQHEAQVGILEPLASIVHTLGTCVAEDIRDVQYEAENLHKDLLAAHAQTDIVGEWKLRELPVAVLRLPIEKAGGRQVKQRYARGNTQSADLLPQIMIVPYGVYLDSQTQERLIAWVRAGGVLVATGPVGLYDQLGKQSARLLQTAFPGLEVKRADGSSAKLAQPRSPAVRKRWTLTHAAVSTRYDTGEGAVLQASLGKGKVVISGFPHTDAPEVVRSLVMEQVNQHAPANVTADNRLVQLYLTRRGEVRILYVINEDHRRPEQVALGFRAPVRITDLRAAVCVGTRSSLTLDLLPGECRVLKLERP